MPRCGLCGSETEKMFEINLEGAEMIVCSNCAKLGQVIKEVVVEQPEETEEYQQYKPKHTSSARSNPVLDVIVSDYGRRVKNARESKGWKQKELATKLAIKESLLHNIESGHFEPNMKLAQKLEKFLHITLIDQVEDKPVNIQHSDSGPMTLGDIMKTKRK